MAVEDLCHKYCCAKYTIRIYIFYNTNMANHEAAVADLFGSESDNDELVPALVENDDIPVPILMNYEPQTILTLRVKEEFYDIPVGTREWVFVGLELTPAFSEWGYTLEHLSDVQGMKWITSAVHKLRWTRPLIQTEHI